MTGFQRRPSLLFNDYENAITSKDEEEQNRRSQLKNGKLRIGTDPKKISIDDIDMMALPTSFDRQMLLGSPMYLEGMNQDEDGCLVLESYSKHESHCSKPVPSDASNLHLEDLCNDQNPFDSIVDLRVKYILASSQSASANIKYDINRWFLYPKPLPKFWKFAHDKRLQSIDSIDNDEYSNLDESLKKGYYLPTAEEYHFSMNGTETPSNKSGKVHYTGEFFELKHYIREFEIHKEKFSPCPSRSQTPEIPSFQDFRKDLHFIIKTVQQPVLTEISHRRLKYLTEKFDLFQLLNSKAEILENKRVPVRDFYNARKVDRGLLFSGLVTQRQLSEFIWEKINVEPNRHVFKSPTGELYSLTQIFGETSSSKDSLQIGLKIINDEFLEWYKDVYLARLHIIPSKDVFKLLTGKELRFYFLANIFLEMNNFINGEYLAELFIRHCVHNLEKSKYQLAEISVDFQFFENDELSWWKQFSHWIIKWKVVSHNIRWNVQFSRCYSKLYALGRIKNFQEFLDLIFKPLFSPDNQSNMELQFFLSNVCSFDLVVSQFDDYLWKEFPSIETQPIDWTNGDNPTISHYMYYIYRNLSALNNMRQSRYLNTISLRSYCSPLSNRTAQSDPTLNFSDQVESLVCNLLLCEGGIIRAEPLWKCSSMLPYLFYLCQIPMVVAPLSSVSTRINESHQNDISTAFQHDAHKATRDIAERERFTYVDNPFMDFFKVGMKASLSSSSVLFNSSYTSEPLIEEYSVAASIYLLNAADLCEFSRTSVLCSGYEGFYKAHWVGVTINKSAFFKEKVGLVDTWYDKEEDTSERHNVPQIRRRYRRETLDQEWEFIREQFQLTEITL